MNTKKPLAVLLCAALALTLAACGAKTDPEPQPTATPEVTATPEPTTTPEPTAEPTATPEEAMAEETNADTNEVDENSQESFGPGAHVKLEGATKTTYPGTDVEALEKDGVYYTVFSDGTTDGSYYVIDNEGNLSVELPWMGALQELSGEDATDKAKEYLESEGWKNLKNMR